MIANSAVLEFVGRDDEVVWQEQGEQGELTSSMKEIKNFVSSHLHLVDRHLFTYIK